MPDVSDVDLPFDEFITASKLLGFLSSLLAVVDVVYMLMVCLPSSMSLCVPDHMRDLDFVGPSLMATEQVSAEPLAHPCNVARTKDT